jgi:hypothetical protein
MFDKSKPCCFTSARTAGTARGLPTSFKVSPCTTAKPCERDGVLGVGGAGVPGAAGSLLLVWGAHADVACVLCCACGCVVAAGVVLTDVAESGFVAACCGPPFLLMSIRGLPTYAMSPIASARVRVSQLFINLRRSRMLLNIFPVW